MPDRDYKLSLGRVKHEDVRDTAYPMSRALDTHEAALNSSRIWRPGPVLDQGQTPQCTSFAWKGWLTSSPLREGANIAEAVLYQDEQEIDQIPMPHDGSTVRAGADRLKDWGYVANYLWAAGEQDVINWLLAHGPVMMGTDWYNSMFTPDVHGLMRLDKASGVAGGHAWYIYGYWATSKLYYCSNSWGVGWGLAGRFTIQSLDLAFLLLNGEACVAVKDAVDSLPVPH